MQNKLHGPKHRRPATTSGRQTVKSNVTKDQQDVVTYTYAPGELIPHETIITVPKSKEILKNPQHLLSASSSGKMPAEQQPAFERRLDMLGMKALQEMELRKSYVPLSDHLKRKLGISGGRWGYN